MTKIKKTVKSSKAYLAKKITKVVLINALVAVFALIVVFPFYIMIVTSIKPFGEGMYFSWWPENPTLEAFKFILIPNETTKQLDLNLPRSFMNTLIVTIPGTTVGIVTSAMSGYVFAKREFKGKHLMFTLMLSALMLPSAVKMVSLYLIYAKIGWVDTLLPLLVPQMFGTVSLVFAFRQYMYGIPNSLIEVARLDGANHVKIFFLIALPLAMPVIIAHWLLTFMAGYNQYIEPLLYIFDPKWETLQLTLSRYSQTIGVQNTPIKMAAAAISMVPLILLYACSQKFFAKGVMTGALKG